MVAYIVRRILYAYNVCMVVVYNVRRTSFKVRVLCTCGINKVTVNITFVEWKKLFVADIIMCIRRTKLSRNKSKNKCEM